MSSNTSNSRNNGFKRLKYEPITIKEPHKYNVKTFEDPNDFTAYYREHEEEFKNLSTLILNRTYKIPGYRISVINRGKENEELTLRKDYYTSTDKEKNCENEMLKQIISRIENIEQFLEQLKE